MEPTPPTPHRVVVIGGGFGGLRVTRRLAALPGVEITLVDRANHHLFQPLLYQVATGILAPGQIAPPLRDLFARRASVRVLLAEATGFDLAARTVTARAVDELTLPYDTLVVAAGATDTYFGHDEWAADAPGMKSIDDAHRVRTRVLGAFEIAETLTDPAERAAWLTFVVVGAGPTGVELAGQLAFLAHRTLAGSYRTIRSQDARIVLADAAPTLLGTFPKRLQRKAQAELERMGVEVRLGTLAVGVDADGIDLRGADGDARLPAHNVIWAAGVTASPLARLLGESTGAPVDRGGRVRVQPDLTLPGHPEVFAIGDMAAVDGVPGVAQGAMQEAAYAFEVIAQRLAEEPAPGPFRYRDRGSMAVVGRSWAIAHIGPLRLSGRLGWMVWAVVHIAFLVGFQNRLETMRRWLWDITYRRRSERVISAANLVDRARARPPGAVAIRARPHRRGTAPG